MSEGIPALVFDNGSSGSKIGFAGDDAPRGVFRTIVGRPNKKKSVLGGGRDVYVGDEASALRGLLSLKSPIVRGIIQNDDDMELIWDHSFKNELRVLPEESKVMMTDCVLGPKRDREKKTQIMFETFNTLGVYIAHTGICTHYASGRNTALCVDIGEGVTTCMPIINGYNIENANMRSHLGGMDLTAYLQTILTEQGVYLETSAEMESVGEMKEKLCYVALDHDDEMLKYGQSSKDWKEYDLNDGTKITLGNERIRCPEVLFNPSLVGKQCMSISQMIAECVQRCDLDTRKDFWGNIVIAGGPSMTDGFTERLQKELSGIAPQMMKVKVVANPERKYSSWIGGSILASFSRMDSLWMTKDDYDENGPFHIHKKCL